MTTYLEFVAEMSKGEQRELESRLAIAIEHLLKLKHVRGQTLTDNLRGWQRSLRNQHTELADHIEANKGLKSKLTPEVVDRIYRSVLMDLRTLHPHTPFPSSRTLSVEEIVGPGVWKEIGPKPKAQPKKKSRP
jgi:hypothetical protein